MKTPFVLLPYQQAWLADTSAVKVWEKSRRIGASWADAADSSLLAASSGGMDCWYIGYNREMAREYINDCAFWARNYQLAAGEVAEEIIRDEDKDILTYRIVFASGHRITALSSRPTNLRGKQGKVVIDEAAFHDDLPGLLKASLAMLIWGGRVCVISSHNGVDSAFNSLVGDARAGKLDYSVHRATFDDALEAGLYRRICLVTNQAWTPEGEQTWRDEIVKAHGDSAQEELFCVPANSGGAYLSRALIEAAMFTAPVVRYSAPEKFVNLPEHVRRAEIATWCEERIKPLLTALNRHCRHYFGVDFGRKADLSVIAPIAREQNLSYTVPFMVELFNVPFHQQEQILFYIADGLPKLLGGALDSTGNGAYLGEVAAQRYGSRIAQVMFNNPWYVENMPRFRASFEDGRLKIPRDADVLADLRQIQVIKGIPKIPDVREKGKDGKQRHADSAIALALAHYAATRDTGPIEFEALNQPRASARAWEDSPIAGGSLDIHEDRGFGVVAGHMDLRGY
ncbi:hypothetical protein HZB60_04080 [candidate division KSB1 bacterium]|nr:hypothetical protein [candidate division KSB1 bacterium]